MKQSDALVRVLNREKNQNNPEDPKPDPFGIYLSLGQLKKLADFDGYEGNKPDGVFIMAGRRDASEESTSTIEIIPYVNDLDNPVPGSPKLKYFVNRRRLPAAGGFTEPIEGEIYLDLGYVIPKRMDFQDQSFILNSGDGNGGGLGGPDGAAQTTPPN